MTIDPLPVVDLGNDTTLCSGGILTLDATNFGASYVWQDATTNAMLTVSTAGQYYVAVDLNGCITRDTINVGFNSFVVDLGNDTALCQGESLTLDATTPGAGYVWQDATTNAMLTVSTAGQYHVEVVVSGCPTVRDTIDVTIDPLPVINLGNDTTFCQGESLILDATTPGAGYVWQDATTNAMLTVSTAGQYHVAVDLNGCVTRDTIDVTIDPLPVVNLGNDTALCQGESLTLDATNSGASYLWQDATTNAMLTVNTAGQYHVAVDLNGCVTRDTIDVTINPLPVVNLGNDTTICSAGTLTLDATNSGASYVWQDATTNAMLTVSTAGQYHVAVDLNGCITRDTINVGFNSLVVDLGNDTTLCQGDILTLDVTNPGGGYVWQDASTNSTFDVIGTGQYYVNVSVSTCGTTSDTINVNFNPLPVVNLGNDTVLCQGETLTLDATNPAGASYAWQDVSTNPTFDATVTMMYHVGVMVSGCATVRDTVNVTFNPLPIVDLGDDDTLCQGDILTLDATNPAGASYVWQDATTNAMLTVSGTGQYHVDVSVAGCATVSDSINVNFNSFPTVNLGDDDTLCQGDVLTLDATNTNATYVWQDASTNPTFDVTDSGMYYVDVSVIGCGNAKDTVNVNFKPLPMINDIGDHDTLCEGFTVIIDIMSDGDTFLWQDSTTMSRYTVAEQGLYWVEVGLNGCTARDSVEYIFNPRPGRVDLGDDIILCEGDTLILNAASTNATYFWQDGSTDSTFNVTAPGMYKVELMATGCPSASDSINVGFNPLPVVDLGNDTTLCDGETLTLDATIAGASYLWQDSTTNSTFNAIQQGIYGVEVEVGSCRTTDTISIDFFEPLVVDYFADDTTLCEGDTLLLDATTPTSTYIWQDSTTASTFNVTEQGVYLVEVTVGGCGTVSDSINVNFNLLPIVDLGNDTTLCEGETLLIGATTPGATYLWQDGSVDPVFRAAEIDRSAELEIYWVEVTNDCGTTADTLSILFEDCTCTMYVPTSFTPNSDNKNERFSPVTNCELQEYRFVIINRSGQTIFETNDYNDSWDGTYKGSLSPIGAYLYDVRYVFKRISESQNRRISQEKTGRVILLR